MGNTHQTPLGFHFLKASQVESAEAHIVFDDAKDGLHFDGARGTQALADLTGEVGSGLMAVLEQAEADADLAVAFCAGALSFERAAVASMAFIQASIGDIAIVGSVTGSILEG